MSKSFWGYAGAVVAAYFGQWQIAVSLLAQGVGAERQRKARNQARDAYNASLQDRMIMTDLQPDAPRTLVLGRVRAVEGVRRRWASGTHSETLTLIVSFAGHEIDGFETFWFNDQPLRIDGDGYVETPAQLTGCSVVRSGTTAILTKTGHGIADGERVLIAGFSLPEFNGTFSVFNSTANTFSYAIPNAGSGDPPGTPGTVDVLTPYTRTENVTEYLTGTLDGAGEASVTLTSTPLGGTVAAMWTTGTGDASSQGPLTVTLDTGLDYDLTDGVAGASYQVSWQTVQVTPMARIRTYLGTDTQNVGDDLAAEYPGHLTDTDAFAGIALAVIDLTYSEDAYPQGIPNITATMRGAKCFDPRDDSTAWTENPALHALHYATWDHGWRVPIGEIREQDVIDAADECDVSTVFTLGADDYTLERYRCGIVISSAADPRQSMGDIMETMAGRWGWAGGTLRMRCGRMATPAWAMDQSWVAQQVGQGGQVAAGSVVKITNGVPREDKVNHVSGTCIDPAQRYQALPYPAVRDDVLIAADGAEYRLEAVLPGVNHIAHAQHLASITIREGQAPLRMEVSSNLSAYPLELFDVGTVTLPRYGMSAKTMEVTGWRWRPTEGVQLRLAEITEAMFEPVDSLNGRDPAPNGNLQSPWYVAPVTGVDVDSEAEIQPDGAVLTLTVVTWDAIVSQAVLNGGRVEVQYTRANAIPASGVWPSWIEQGGATSATIPGLKAQAFYLFRVRAVNALGVRGPWSAQVLHQVLGDLGPPENVANFASAIKPGTLALTWDECVAADYDVTEIRVGASWAAGVFGWAGKASERNVARPANGDYTLWAAHKDLSGNYSTTPTQLDVTIDDSIDGGAGSVLVLQVAPDPVFVFADATTHTSATPEKTFTARLINTFGTATWSATAYDAITAGSSIGAVTMGGSGNERTMTAAQFVAPGTSGSVRRVEVTATAPDGAADTVTVIRYDPSVTAPYLYLTDPQVAVQTDEAGEGGDYSVATTDVKVLLAGAFDTDAWSISITPDSGVTATINGTAGPVTGTFDVTVAVSAMTIPDGAVLVTATKGADTLTGTFRVVKRPATGTGYVVYWDPRSEIFLPVNSAGDVTSYADAWSVLRIFKGGVVDETADWSYTKDDTNCTSTLTGSRVDVTSMATLGGVGTVETAALNVAAAGWSWISGIYAADGHYIAIGQNSNPSSTWDYIYHSTDLQTWTMINVGATGRWSLAGYDEGNFILSEAGVAPATRSRISSDGGLTWSAGGTLATGAQFDGMGSGGGVVLLAPIGGTTGNKSTDGGVTWASHSFPFGGMHIWHCAGDNWVGNNTLSANLASTDNGSTWSTIAGLPATIWDARGYAGRSVVTFNSTSAQAAYSDDGLTFVVVALPQSMYRPTLCIVRDVLYMIGSNNLLYTTDGKVWRDGGGAVGTDAAGVISDVSIDADYLPCFEAGGSDWLSYPLDATSETVGSVTVTATKAGEENIVRTLVVRKGRALDDYYLGIVSPPYLQFPATSDGVVTDYSNGTLTCTITKNGVDDTDNWAFAFTATHLTPSSGSGPSITITAMDSAEDEGVVTFVASKAGAPIVSAPVAVRKNKGGTTSGPRSGVSFTGASVTATYVALKLTSGGYVQFKEGSGGSYVTIGQYVGAPAAGVGAALWVRVDVTGHALDSGTTGTFLQLSSDREWALSDATSGTHRTDMTIILATSSGGAGAQLNFGALQLIVP